MREEDHKKSLLELNDENLSDILLWELKANKNKIFIYKSRVQPRDVYFRILAYSRITPNLFFKILESFQNIKSI